MPEKIDSATITINGKDGWTLLQAEIVEAVSAMGFVHAEVLNDDATIAPASLLSQAVMIRIPTLESTQPWREVKGIVWQARSLGPYRKGDDRSVYQLIVLPAMMAMSLRRLDRSFNGLPAMQVWQEVLEEWGDRVPYKGEGPMMALENEPCTEVLQNTHQSQETDLEFLLRLLSLHGVFWYQDHSGSEALPVLRLGTFSGAAAPWGNGTSLRFNPQETEIKFGPYVSRFTREAFEGPRTPVVIGMHPALKAAVQPANLQVVAQSPASRSFKGFEWFQEESLSPQLGLNLGDMQSRSAKVIEQAMALDDQWGMGVATTTTVVPGHKITIEDLPGGADEDWFVTSTRLLVAGPGIANSEDSEESSLLTGFRAVPLSMPFRPPLDPTRLDPPPLQGGIGSSGFQQVSTLGG